VYPLLTRDPITGGELIVTRLESPDSGIVIEGRFRLDIAYNTARARLDEIVALLGGTPEQEPRLDRRQILDRLAAREISVEEALRLLKGTEHEQRK